MSNRPIVTWVGYDPREAEAFAVCRNSIKRFDRHSVVKGLVLRQLQDRGLYWRPTARRLGRLWDDISEAHMSTEFAISRFLVPQLCRQYLPQLDGWAVFMDCDIFCRSNLERIRPHLDESKAVCCVKHDHRPSGTDKMDGQLQTVYPRKNWSSVMAFNIRHPANDRLTFTMVNEMPGRDLHRFCWLADDEIGELPPEWNYLVGVTQNVADPKLVHFTEGGPWLQAFEEVEFAGEWFAQRDIWANGGPWLEGFRKHA